MSWVISNILPVIFVLSVLVFVHEYGHFWVGRRNGVRVTTFSIGFGPELFGWTDKEQTRWRVSLIPLGGYVKFFGDQDVSSSTADQTLNNSLSEAEKATILHNKTPLQRIAVAAAGPVANYVFAIVILTAIYLFKGIPSPTATIGFVQEYSFAAKIGLKVNDIVVGFGDHTVKNFKDLTQAFAELKGKETILSVKRDGQKIDFTAKLFTEENGQKTPIKLLGISAGGDILYEKTSTFDAVKHSINYCYTMSVQILVMLGKLITGSGGGDVGGLGCTVAIEYIYI